MTKPVAAIFKDALSLGISINRLAALSGVDRTTLFRWKRAAFNPRMEQLEMVRRTLEKERKRALKAVGLRLTVAERKTGRGT